MAPEIGGGLVLVLIAQVSIADGHSSAMSLVVVPAFTAPIEL